MLAGVGNELASIMAISNWHQTISNGSNEKSTGSANCRRVAAAAAAAVATTAATVSPVFATVLYARGERDRLPNSNFSC